ncbi:UTP--glucose-1-phosphate uridylyltransferase GalU [Calderihabitans maritimus]|uniref:UTP--glucose-1-phosphate uridylyltransferase n=1 Tax=Calderihabitans maritimus TaxID=1246530 RepID=A0A1Z5HXE6_9FIRM|nr:UTP--glucose-1-phosphate uridylyltransferase GalU [Calderihabitans maritimus]GAW94037.1 UDP-glucose pyrophosphorylase [Calderihabitans maritimus]
MKVRKAIIPAAGLGTRFLPATKAQPKEMLPIIDKPAIQYIVEEAVASGIEDILIITGRNKRAIEDHFDKSVELELTLKEKNHKKLLEMVQDISNLVDIHYVRQKEPKGLGHAVYCARKFVGNEPFAVLLGDDIIHSKVPCLKQMLQLYDKYQSTIIGVQEVPVQEVRRYGIVKPVPVGENLYKVDDLIEKPTPEQAPSTLAIMGRYIIDPAIFDILQNTEPGAGGEIQLTDALRNLLRQQPIYAYVFEGKRYDVGDKFGYLQAIVEFALQREEINAQFTYYLKNLIRELGT